MTFRSELKMHLEPAGFTVLEAVDGEDGLNKAVATAVDMIISDLNMPKMDGLTMCSHLREQGVQAPIFMLTTQASPELKAKAAQFKVTAWIVKPPNFASLVKAIKKVLGIP